MDSFIDAVVTRLNSDPGELRKIERARMGEVYVQRYLASPQHEQFQKLARELETVPWHFVFTSADNSTLIATYDFYLSRTEWFQICFQLSEDGSATVTVYNSDGHYTWNGEEIEELVEKIVEAHKKPRTFGSVVG